MMGSEIKPIEITAAATTPVVAASSAPTKITAIARPPRSGPNTWPTVSSRSSAMPERSRMIPMKVKNGMASSVSFCMMPKTRSGRAWNNEAGKMPASIPIKPKPRPVAAKANATGKPLSKNTNSPANIRGTNCCARKVVCIQCSPASLRAARASSSLSSLSSDVPPSSWDKTSGPRSNRKAKRLISSDTPCSINSPKPSGIRP